MRIHTRFGRPAIPPVCNLTVRFLAKLTARLAPKQLSPDDNVVAIKELAEEAIVEIKFVFSNTKPQSYQQYRDAEL